MTTNNPYLTPEELLAKKAEYMIPAIHYYRQPIHVVRGEKQWLFDSEGKRYLDCFGGILTVILGHTVPEINEKVKNQLDKLQHTSTLYLIQPMLALAERLHGYIKEEKKKCFFVNSGTEAVEGAVMMAKYFNDNNEIITLENSYHGRSFIAQQISGKLIHASKERLDNITFIPSPYCYRCSFNKSYPDCNLECARSLEEAICTSTSGKRITLIVEPIQGVGGIIVPPAEYFPIIYDIVKKYEGLLICDEVQTGFGRTGDHFFGIDHWGIDPDLITLAKGMANGYPIGAYMANVEIADNFKGPNISTFGGNHISTTAALANLDLIERERLIQNSGRVGRYFRERLLALKEESKLIGDVRAKGMIIGIELVTDKKEKTVAPKETDMVMETAKDKGLLIGKTGNIIRLGPSLRFNRQDVDLAMDILMESIWEVEKTLT